MMRNIEKLLPSPLVLLIFLGSYAALVIMGQPVFSDADSLWHIAAGDLMRETGRLPAHDPWSFTAGAEQPWYLISWLFDLLLSLVHAAGGVAAVYLLPQLLLALLVAVVMRGVLARGGIGSDVVILLAIAATLALATFATARPQLIAFLLAAAMHQLLHASREHEHDRRLWLLPPMMALWVNVHGSFVVGISLLGAYGLEALMLKRWAWFRRLFAVGVASALALVANPYGITMFTAVSRTLDSAITQYIQEWLPFVFSSDLGLSLWFVLFVGAANFRESAAPIADRILAAAWFVMMLFSIRNAGSFVILSAPFIAINLQRWLSYLDAIVTKRPDIMETLGRPGMAVRLALAIIAVLAGSYAMLGTIKPGYRVDKAQDGAAAIDVAAAQPGRRFLNDYGLGGQMIYQARGHLPLFIDGRAGTAYPEPVLEDYIKFLFLDKGWQDLLDRYRIDGIIIRNSHRFAMAYEAGQYHDQWKEIFHDEAASVYIKR